jgi:hypothetical protein
MINELRYVIKKFRETEKAWLSPEKNTDSYLAAVCLLEYPSYRLKESDQRDRLIGFRTLRRTIRRIFHAGIGLKRVDQEGTSLVIGGGAASKDIISYISRSGKVGIHTYMERDTMSLNGHQAMSILLAFLPFGVWQALRCIRSRYRRNLALSITEVVEIAFLLHYVNTHKLNPVYDFLPYEVDSNFMFLLLKEQGTHVVKIPSSGPMATHHKILISDDVVFSTPYHYEEYQKFRNTIRIRHQLLWPPERAHQYYDRYSHQKPPTTRKTLGFYSHGEWLRREEKHSAYGGRIGEAEHTILQYMGRFVLDNPGYSIIIFPHPRENKHGVIQRRDEFYTRALGNAPFTISGYIGGTSQNFDKCDIALAAFSTILYERLYCGYKTLIGNMFIFEFPMNKSTLNNICFKEYHEMSELILRYSAVDDQTYFEETGLTGYLLENYPEP